MMQVDPNYVQERSAWVIMRDFEQEACFILMLWAFAIMAYKSTVTASRERKLLRGRSGSGDRGHQDPARGRARVRATDPVAPRGAAAVPACPVRC